MDREQTIVREEAGGVGIGLSASRVGSSSVIGRNQYASLETVRALHETVVSLREALERAKSELAELRNRATADGFSQTQEQNKENDEPTKHTSSNEKKSSCFQKRKQRMSSSINVQIKVSASGRTGRLNSSTTDEGDANEKEQVIEETTTKLVEQEIVDDTHAPEEVPPCDENNTAPESRLRAREVSSDNLHLDVDALSLQSMSDGDNSVFSDGTTTPCDPCDTGHLQAPPRDRDNASSGNESDGVDDIELIFTTDDTKAEDLDKRDDLVSIADDAESGGSDWRMNSPKEGGDTPILLCYRKLPNESSENFVNEIAENTNQDDYVSAMEKHQHQISSDSLLIDRSFDRDKSSSFERDESFDRFDDPSGVGSGLMGRRWSQFGRSGNPPIETDISKCGVVDEEYNLMARRNTCPNPTPYRPIIHREALGLSAFPSRAPRLGSMAAAAAGTSTRRPSRPILHGSNVGPRRESGAQTDISALPGAGGVQWRSESHLAGADKTFGSTSQFTLPSKFALPDRYCKYSLRLSEKTQENRRVMLSDINFTSMVPELSRSADHLCQEDVEEDEDEPAARIPTKSAANARRDYTRSGRYSNSLTPSVSLSSTGFGANLGPHRLNSLGTGTADFGGNRIRASSGDLISSKQHSKPRLRASLSLHSCSSKHLPSSKYKVSFRDSAATSGSASLATSAANLRGSLPDLRCSDHTGVHGSTSCCHCSHKWRHCYIDSRGSTESLVDEADDFLRRSADLMPPPAPPVLVKCPASQRRRSDSDVINDAAPSSATPFLPRSSRDLKPGQRVKVIGGRAVGGDGGRVLAGRVRYVGTVAGARHPEDYVGVQLATPSGDSDGTFMGRRFFNCEPQHALFVPFNKIVMAWVP